jgi:hypothetical protein
MMTAPDDKLRVAGWVWNNLFHFIEAILFFIFFGGGTRIVGIMHNFVGMVRNEETNKNIVQIP